MLSFNNIKIHNKSIEMVNSLDLSIPLGCSLNVHYSNKLHAKLFYQIIFGFYKPENGYVSFNNTAIESDLDLYHRHIISGISPQDSLHDNISVIDNLEFWAKLHNTEEMLLAALTYFEVVDYVNTKYKDLSADIKIRILLIRLLVFNTRIWLLDINFQNLETRSQDMLYKLIISKLRDGGIVITFNDINNDFIHLGDYFGKSC